MQSAFLGALRKRVEEILNFSLDSRTDFSAYIKSGKWPTEDSQGKMHGMILSWYLQWYSVPSALDIKRAADKIKRIKIRSSVPLLRLVFPTTHITTIDRINNVWCSSEED